jgi:ketosteroid isomerase-like protein
MSSRATEKEIVKLEKEFWQALKDRDVDAALRMTDDPCIVTGAQGVGTIDHEAFRGMMDDATWTLEDFELEDVQVRMVGDDIAIVAYKVREDVTVDGESLRLEAADASTWVRHGDHWVCALHTESITGDPFGRDRQPA